LISLIAGPLKVKLAFSSHPAVWEKKLKRKTDNIKLQFYTEEVLLKINRQVIKQNSKKLKH